MTTSAQAEEDQNRVGHFRCIRSWAAKVPGTTAPGKAPNISKIAYNYRQNGEVADYDLIGIRKHFLGLVVLQTNNYGQSVYPMGI